MIFALRSRADHLRDRLSAAEGALAVSAITVAEPSYGAERSYRSTENRAAESESRGLVEVIVLDSAGPDHAGRIRTEHGALDTPIGAYDALIAGTARSRGPVVVTNNLKALERVDGLLVKDWGRS